MSLNAQTGRLSGTPASGDLGLHGSITIVASDGQASTSLPPFAVEVTSLNAPPVISGSPLTSISVNQAYSFVPTASDPDGDSLSFSITNRPGWASFNTATGALSGTPDAGDVRSYNGISITVNDGALTDTLGPFSLIVFGVNAPPVINGSPSAQVTATQAYNFVPTASDPDGDSLSFSIANRPSWASFDSNTGALSGTPTAGNVGLYSAISITVDDGEFTDTLGPFSINVVDVIGGNAPPVISGSPSTSVSVNQVYTFVPSASDPDGDTLSFSIVNRPSWATFNGSTGRLSGTPDAGDINSYNAIAITVNDGELTDTLGPFSINVIGINTPPVISGTPAVQAMVTQAYNFVPTASDPDGDALAFSIVNRPAWLSFDSNTGALSGTPTAGNVGVYNAISITVDDGEFATTLGPFSINVVAVASGTATLSWMPPTENTDGSPLTDLAGFNIYWGTSPANYSNSVTIANPGLTTYVVDNLLPGNTYYFTTTAFNSDDLESTFSNVTSKTIP
jgi:hypothetical protein